MKSIFETEINIPQTRLAELYANPENSTKWMLDVERYEPISGIPGMPGFKFRLVPKKGKMIFTATIISKNLPSEIKLNLDASNVNVVVTGKFISLPAGKTRFISEEVFTFKGIFNKIFGFLAQSAVRNAHHKHMNDFIEFARTAS